MGNNNSSGNDDFSGFLLNIFSLAIGIQNLEENRQQSAANNIEKHNQEQEKHILNDLHEQFDKQNELLLYQNNLLEEILNILKGEKKYGL